MENIKAAIFDLDGTIINTLTDLANAGNYVLKKNGFPIHDNEEYRFFVGSGIRNLCIRILPEDKKNDEEWILKIFDQFNEYYGKHYMDNTCAYDGINEMLDTLIKNDIKVAVLTNKGHEFTVPMLKKVFGEFPFSVILGKTDKYPVKPSRECIMHVIGELDVKSSECIYIGDSNVDMKTAINGDIENIIGVSWGFRPIEELKEAGAKYIVDTPKEIIEIVNKLNEK
ncbi:HAD family hydrolase [Anaerofustis stercorihominis]|uniref:Haloacid dehalogenase-like hydrolase n=2 Tax=Anaerofustis stercorihominis TaxID=214853 RepID=B1CAL1_9FIRM|nr:HAD family hydrolase [Anaerofustis stercorihominis]EDS72484.1 haloacid dehalogenase-like hydrolase [Anaerofustis stercorihominis DSM 17244]MCQ4795277.1 HAD family hydrolase [Anaerofustis stercorihominis]RGD73573.1 HAD family hydrolase [Anaerofustis stercorihominis]